MHIPFAFYQVRICKGYFNMKLLICNSLCYAFFLGSSMVVPPFYDMGLLLREDAGECYLKLFSKRK